MFRLNFLSKLELYPGIPRATQRYRANNMSKLEDYPDIPSATQRYVSALLLEYTQVVSRYSSGDSKINIGQLLEKTRAIPRYSKICIGQLLENTQVILSYSSGYSKVYIGRIT